MAETKQVEVDKTNRVFTLEYSLIRTRDALRVVTRSLEDLAEKHASADERELTEEDISTLYGAVTLLDCVTADCDKVFRGQ